MGKHRYLIVNADDFGQSSGINRAVVRTHEAGIVTSASLMVRWPAAAEAAACARLYPNLSLGLHIDLGEWMCRQGEWLPRYEVVPIEDADAVAAEVAHQLETFRRLVGSDPTHLDSHQHVHTREPGRSVLRELSCKLGVPVRHETSGIGWCGRFYGQTEDGDPLPDAIGVASLLAILSDLPAGCTELTCHPGEGDDLDSTYRRERSHEVQTLCDARVRSALAAAEIQLISFHDLDRTGIRFVSGQEVACGS
jgi:predicted glycoside hydrolase/deacetylase ChbG (UPF0249 family)